MTSTWQNLTRRFAIGLAVGIGLLVFVLLVTKQKPRQRELASKSSPAAEVPLPAEDPEVTAAKMHQRIDHLIQRALSDMPSEGSHSEGPLSLQAWRQTQLSFIERLDDATQREALFAELKFLKEQAYLPGSGSGHWPEAGLIEYAFIKWAEQDPDAALALESELITPPTALYWFALNGIIHSWSQSAPFTALDGVLRRLEREPQIEKLSGGPRLRTLFEAAIHEDPERFLERIQSVSIPLVLNAAGHALLKWRQEDEEAADLWLQSFPDHPVAAHKRFQEDLASQNRPK